MSDLIDRIVYVTWRDAKGGYSWEDGDNVARGPLPTIHSVGFFLYEEDDHIALSQSLDPIDNTWDGRMLIPKVLIVEQMTVRKRD